MYTTIVVNFRHTNIFIKYLFGFNKNVHCTYDYYDYYSNKTKAKAIENPNKIEYKNSVNEINDLQLKVFYSPFVEIKMCNWFEELPFEIILYIILLFYFIFGEE